MKEKGPPEVILHEEALLEALKPKEGEEKEKPRQGPKDSPSETVMDTDPRRTQEVVKEMAILHRTARGEKMMLPNKDGVPEAWTFEGLIPFGEKNDIYVGLRKGDEKKTMLFSPEQYFDWVHSKKK